MSESFPSTYNCFEISKLLITLGEEHKIERLIELGNKHLLFAHKHAHAKPIPESQQKIIDYLKHTRGFSSVDTMLANVLKDCDWSKNDQIIIWDNIYCKLNMEEFKELTTYDKPHHTSEVYHILPSKFEHSPIIECKDMTIAEASKICTRILKFLPTLYKIHYVAKQTDIAAWTDKDKILISIKQWPDYLSPDFVTARIISYLCGFDHSLKYRMQVLPCNMEYTCEFLYKKYKLSLYVINNEGRYVHSDDVNYSYYIYDS